MGSVDDPTRFVSDIVPGSSSFYPIPSAGLRVVEVKTASSRALAAMVGALNDLNLTIVYCDTYIRVFGQPDESTTIVDALWSSALVAYFRACDANGKNARVDLAVLDTVEGTREAHNHFRDLRSKYVAHSVNSLEQVSVVAVLTDAPMVNRKIVNIMTGHASFNPLNEDGANSLKRLAQMLRVELQSRVSEATEAVARELDGMALDDVYKLENVRFTIPDVEAMSKSRR